MTNETTPRKSPKRGWFSVTIFAVCWLAIGVNIGQRLQVYQDRQLIVVYKSIIAEYESVFKKVEDQTGKPVSKSRRNSNRWT